MLEIARDCAGRESQNCFSFGNFCSFNGELQQCREQGPSSQHILPNDLAEKRLNKPADNPVMSVSEPCKVFLGGSCNPTTWRKDIAIPIFNRYGISFYNPQVTHWDKSLIELEHNAKQQAAVLLFVFDRKTRNVAAIAEAAYMAASGRKLVIVFDNYCGAGQLINGEAISQREYEELTSALKTLQDIVCIYSIPTFTHIKQAITWTAKSLKNNSWSMKNEPRSNYQSCRNPCQLAEKLVKSNNTSREITRITLPEACVVFKIVVGRDLTKSELKTIEKAKSDLDKTIASDVGKDEILLSFDEFCCILSEFDSREFEKNQIWNLLLHSVNSSIQKYVDWALPLQHSVNSSATKNVYLGGDDSSWRENKAIPFLHKHGLTYCIPYPNSIAPLDSSFSTSVAAALEECRVLLFVIGNSSRNISQIAIANYCIGMGFPVVLCVKMLSQETIIDEEQLSSYANKDYNRGRSYLIDQANKDSVPVFHDIADALECVVNKCKTTR